MMVKAASLLEAVAREVRSTGTEATQPGHAQEVVGPELIATTTRWREEDEGAVAGSLSFRWAASQNRRTGEQEPPFSGTGDSSWGALGEEIEGDDGPSSRGERAGTTSPRQKRME
jgi:hypothetical protein